jgi:hypothetical protein
VSVTEIGRRPQGRVRAALTAGVASAPLFPQLAGAEDAQPFGAPPLVYVTRTPGAARETTVTLTATSESDPSATATATCVVDVAATTVRR